MSCIPFSKLSTVYKGQSVEIPLPCFCSVIQINEQNYTLHFFLDTGSNGSILFVNSIKLIYPDFAIPADCSSSIINLISFEDYSIDTKLRFRLDHQSNFAEPFERPILSGIIGSDLLKDYSILIDFTKSAFTLTKNSDEILSLTCEYFFENNFLFLIANIGSTKLKLLYDTGMGGALALFERGFAKIDQSTFVKTSSEYATGALGFAYKYDGYEQELKLVFSDNLTFDTEFAVQMDSDMTNAFECDGILGNQLFLDRSVCIDYVRQKFSFSPRL
jgi:hypothetical protein